MADYERFRMATGIKMANSKIFEAASADAGGKAPAYRERVLKAMGR